MKRPFLLLLMLTGCPAAFSQSPIQEVIDNALIQQVNVNTQNIMSMLQQQLDEAQKQSQALNDQLTRMGDPSKVTLPVLDLIKQDIALSAQTAANGVEREARLRATTGSEAFGDNAYGLVAAVNPTVTFKDKAESKKQGTDVMVTLDRDPAHYKLQAALMGDLTNLAEKSQQADERITQLEEQRPALLDQLSAATDVATAIKLQAALNTIEAQIASARAEMTKSKQDYDVLQEKLNLQAKVEALAKSEARILERKHNVDKAKAAASSATTGTGAGTTGTGTSGTGTAPKPFSNLSWGSKK
jgi:predicted  nucleic acid-binding Zn-ribbon protein